MAGQALTTARILTSACPLDESARLRFPVGQMRLTGLGLSARRAMTSECAASDRGGTARLAFAFRRSGRHQSPQPIDSLSLHLRVVEAGALEQLQALTRSIRLEVRGIEMPQIPVAEAARQIIIAPIGNHETSAAPQHARHLSKTHCRLPNVVEHAARNHRVKALFVEGQTFSLPLAKLDRRRQPAASDCQHLRHGINAGQLRLRTSPGKLLKQRAGAAAHVEHAVGWPDGQTNQRLTHGRLHIERPPPVVIRRETCVFFANRIVLLRVGCGQGQPSSSGKWSRALSVLRAMPSKRAASDRLPSAPSTTCMM